MRFLLLVFGVCYGLFVQSQEGCTLKNKAFKAGERAVYTAYYQLGPIWVDAGEVIFETNLATFGNKPCYHIKSAGKTYPSYDKFFRVRDRYEAWIDTTTLKAFRYLRDTDDGGFKTYNDNFFNYSKNKVTSYRKVKEKQLIDSAAITECTFDVLSMIYAARNVSFDGLKKNDTIPISLFLDDKTYELSVQYLGKSTLKTELGKFRCIMFSPRLVGGTLFSEGQRMKVWMTDDLNKIPLLVESPVLVGKVKGRLNSISGVRNPMISKIK